MIQRYVVGGFTVPSYGSVRNWVAKRGCYLLDPFSRKESLENDWCIIVDVSISIGAQRLLVVLGVDLSKYDHSLPLQLSDIEVLGLTARTLEGWPATAIAEYLDQQIMSHYSVAYMVSDGGPNLKRAAKDLSLERIDDISHAIATSVKAAYTQVDGFEEFIKKCVHLRRYNGLNDFIDIRPPLLRGKARFMNISSLIYWANDMLCLLDGKPTTRHGKRKLSEKDRCKLEWLRGQSKMIRQMSRELEMIDTISRALKAEGVNNRTVQWAKKLLQSNLVRQYMHDKVRVDLCSYLDNQLAKCERLKRSTVICSTDIIESCFGGYKEERPKGQVVNLHTFRLAAYGQAPMTAYHTLTLMEANNMIGVYDHSHRWIKMKPTDCSKKSDEERDNQTFLSP